MELLDRLTRHPLSALWWGTVTALAAGIAIMGFGAPPWVLVPVAYVGVAVYSYVVTLTRRNAQHGP